MIQLSTTYGQVKKASYKIECTYDLILKTTSICMYLYQCQYFKIQNSLEVELNQGKELLCSTVSISVLFNYLFFAMGMDYF